MASHDLQEPLRKVRAFSSELVYELGDSLSGDAKQYLGWIEDGGARMQQMVSDILSLSRVTTRGMPLVPLDLGKVLEEVLSALALRIEETGGKVETGKLPTLDADEGQMRQLFLNLVGNALKFHRPDVPPHVNIYCNGAGGKEGTGSGFPMRYWDVRVEDNGIGFEEQYLDQIFIPFQRLHGADKYAGTGIGLAICKKIVERHGGNLTAESRPGKGTSFIITLPIKVKNEE